MHHMDDVTAEVDEREEYSNDFDEGGDTTSRGVCKLSDLAQGVSNIKRLAPGDSETKMKEQGDQESTSVKEDHIFESIDDHQANHQKSIINTAKDATAGAAQGCIQEVLKV